MKRIRHSLRFAARCAVALGVVAVLASCALYGAARLALAPRAGEWRTVLRAGPLSMDASVPALLRLGTAHWLLPALYGRTLPTAAGRVQLSRGPAAGSLLVRCASCAVRVPGMGAERIVLNGVWVTVSRNGDALEGELSVDRVNARWQGRFDNGGLRLALQVPATPIADGYALFAGAMPELGRARIEGDFTLAATLSLPDGRFSATPTLTGFEVAGLGTEALAGARSGCSGIASQLSTQSLLARAVIAAEDQRFHTHAGYDPEELAAALASNQSGGEQPAIQRGGSTLTQQLAKLLVTGSERSPVRKLRELLYAVEMERTLGKARILQLYLAHAPWGPGGVCGAESAARRYFGQPAHKLTAAQAAWMAAMLHNPGREVGRWQRGGGINLARTQWVLMGMRPLPAAARRVNAQMLAAMAYPGAPASPVATVAVTSTSTSTSISTSTASAGTSATSAAKPLPPPIPISPLTPAFSSMQTPTGPSHRAADGAAQAMPEPARWPWVKASSNTE